MIRRPRMGDIPEFERISKNYPNNELITVFESGAVIESFNGNIKGFGFTRAILETVFYTEGSVIQRGRAYKELIEVAKKDAQKLGFGQLYAFVDPQFADLLTKRGWRLANDVCIVMDLDNGK